MSDDGSEKSLPSSGRSSPSNAGAARGASGGGHTSAEAPSETGRGNEAGGTAIMLGYMDNGRMPLSDLQEMMGHIKPPSSKAKTEKRPFIGSPSEVHTSASTAGPSSPKRPRTDEESESAAPAPAPTAGPSSALRQDRSSADDSEDPPLPHVLFEPPPPSPGPADDNEPDWRARATPSPGATLAVPTREIRGDDGSESGRSAGEFDSMLNFGSQSNSEAATPQRDPSQPRT